MAKTDDIQITVQDSLLWIQPQQNKLDDEGTHDMQEKTLKAAEENPGLHVVLDMSEVNYMPSVSIGALIKLKQTLEKTKQRFILIGLQEDIRETLTICRLDKFLEICDTLEDAKSRIDVR